jgi:hypothetical protein
MVEADKHLENFHPSEIVSEDKHLEKFSTWAPIGNAWEREKICLKVMKFILNEMFYAIECAFTPCLK